MGAPKRTEAVHRPAETTAPASTHHHRRRRRSSSRPSSHQRRGRLRAFYFSLASLWGFMAGSAAVLIGLMLVGRPAGLGSRGAFYVACAALLALVGGLVVAAAYHTASRRLR